MELGGKSPVIVFADAVQTQEDLEKVVEWIMVILSSSSFPSISRFNFQLRTSTGKTVLWKRCLSREDQDDNSGDYMNTLVNDTTRRICNPMLTFDR